MSWHKNWYVVGYIGAERSVCPAPCVRQQEAERLRQVMRKLVAPGWNLKVEEMTHDEALNGMGTFGVFMRAMTH